MLGLKNDIRFNLIINKHLLSVKVNVYQLVQYLLLKPFELFPKNIKNEEIVNKRKGPINCAADDLELQFNNEEFLNSYLPFSLENDLNDYEVTFDQLYDYSFKQEVPMYLPPPAPPVAPPVVVPAMPPALVPVPASHFTLNMIGLENNYFKDFTQPMNQSPQSSKSSDLSPLDEEFLKQGFYLESQKRPFEEEESPKKRKKSNSETKFECHHCHANFKVKSYLTRHLKKHNTFKAFKCPFYKDPIVDDSTKKLINPGTKCHPTGGFSRRDTFKTHLKALHFIYPPGTKSNKRHLIGGRCAGCFKYFESNAKWLEDHIEPGVCNGAIN